MTADATRTVPVIEDDLDTQEAYAEMIEAATGLAVAVACDGCCALRLLDEGLRPVAIVLDVMMPNGSGFQFCEQLRERNAVAGIPVVVASACPLSAEDLSALAPHRHLVKPFRFRELVEALTEVGARA
jgi:CheY-like chemotaxis protein